MKRHIFPLLAVLSFATLTGCAVESSTPSESAATGTASFALVSKGADGSTYAFPSGARFTIVRDSDGLPMRELVLDGSIDPTATVVTALLPPGTYRGSLFRSPGYPITLIEKPIGTSYSLLRKTDAGYESVDSTLSTAQPVVFTVTASTTTNVTLGFKVPKIGDVSFSTGTVSVSATVSPVDATAKEIVLDGRMSVDKLGFPAPVSPADGVTDVPVRVRAAITGEWITKLDGQCVPVTVTMETDAPSAPFNAFDELTGGAGEFCFMRDYPTFFSLFVQRSGTTRHFSGGTTFSELELSGQLAAAVADDTQVQLSKLVAPQSFSSGQYHLKIWDASMIQLIDTNGNDTSSTIRVR